jgi:hypothetical protein
MGARSEKGGACTTSFPPILVTICTGKVIQGTIIWIIAWGWLPTRGKWLPWLPRLLWVDMGWWGGLPTTCLGRPRLGRHSMVNVEVAILIIVVCRWVGSPWVV